MGAAVSYANPTVFLKSNLEVFSDLSDAILIYSNHGCSSISLSKLERVWGLFRD